MTIFYFIFLIRVLGCDCVNECICDGRNIFINRANVESTDRLLPPRGAALQLLRRQSTQARAHAHMVQTAITHTHTHTVEIRLEVNVSDVWLYFLCICFHCICTGRTVVVSLNRWYDMRMALCDYLMSGHPCWDETSVKSFLVQSHLSSCLSGWQRVSGFIITTWQIKVKVNWGSKSLASAQRAYEAAQKQRSAGEMSGSLLGLLTGWSVKEGFCHQQAGDLDRSLVSAAPKKQWQRFTIPETLGFAAKGEWKKVLQDKKKQMWVSLNTKVI